MEPLRIDVAKARYQALVGVGGIGTGKFFALEGSHTLGREESRAGHFLDQRDYCKLHIISHYVRTLLGPDFATFPIGRVGDDPEGQGLIREMTAAGLGMRHVEVIPRGQTLYSFCFVYPDGSGGNMTTNDSVNATVGAGFVDKAIPLFQEYQERGIALAAPETPLEARRRLLELATEYRFFRAASLTSQEISLPQFAAILEITDLLAINLDEAAALAGADPANEAIEIVARAAVASARKYQPNLQVSITAGKRGGWLWDGNELKHVAAFEVNPTNTAGAGDAYLAGLIAGEVAGLSLSQAGELASVIGALSTLSPHTIHPALDRSLIASFIEREAIELSTGIAKLIMG